MTDVLIVGASARAAAWSALRAGLNPITLDLFADADLRAVATASRFPPGDYPHGLVDWLSTSPTAPWIYLGGLENRPTLIERGAVVRPLWGNDAAALRLARNPGHISAFCNAVGVPFPETRLTLGQGGDWLVKPLDGAGGHGIERAEKRPRSLAGRPVVYQRYVSGSPIAALYLASPHACHLIGVTRQLIGIDWLQAQPFAYCGSIGPITVSGTQLQDLIRAGDAVAAGCGLRGLFGMDAILTDKAVWPLEVNPRYTASVEVLEYALNWSALAAHRAVFENLTPIIPDPTVSRVMGKAIVFASQHGIMPTEGPWQQDLERLGDRSAVSSPPQYADLSAAGSPIEPRQPVMSLYAQAADEASCLHRLRERATERRW